MEPIRFDAPPATQAPPRGATAQLMEPAPQRPRTLPLAARTTHSPSAVVPASASASAPAPKTGIPVVDALRTQHESIATLHRAFLRQQSEVQQQFVRTMFAPLGAPAPVGVAYASAPVSVAQPPVPAPASVAQPPVPAPASVAQPPVPVPDLRGTPAPAVAQPTAPKSPRKGPTPTGPSYTRADLEVLSSGKISSVFGPLFAKQDGYARQVRMPEPPLLLADRVLGIAGKPGEMGTGTIWTETDIKDDAWYLHEGRMPAGILVESGQADLLLISWLGIDFHNKGERVYRLLGCDLTSHGELPRPGDTLTYEIHVDGHANQGDVRLFFFHYDCWVNGELRVTVRNGQAGFFTDKELAESAGILWSAAEAKPTANARLDAPVVACSKRQFTAADIDKLIEGDALACFGPGFERAASHTRTPAMQGGKMRLLDEVTHFDREGGPWGRGYLRARLALQPDHWFFPGHFKNDPCMPGTLMFEGCLQAMSIYLGALGFTLECDGWRFEPIPNHAYNLRCRGQALPTSKEVIYEVFIDEIVGGEAPMIYADLLGSVDGLKAFHCRRMGLRLVPAWPLDAGRLRAEIPADTRAFARVDGFDFDYRSLLSCAWGRPTEAFGKMYEPFDGTRRVARLPGPPYHFMSRVSRVEGPIGGMKVGSLAEVEYDVPQDAWYFAENGARVMPYCVLLEVALQPCGWLASYIGSARTTEIDLVFRNLDGKGTVHREVRDDVERLTTTTTLTSLSTAGGLIIVGFQVKVWETATQDLVYTFDTVFGFFPGETMRNQVGLPTTPEERAKLTLASEIRIDLAERPARLFGPSARLAEDMLLMIDRVTGYWPTGGAAGLGRIRAEKDVDPAEWFFKAHFFQDPVQPGSLGLEALLQALQVLMLERGMAEGMESPRFEAIALDVPMSWKYRGQVIPTNATVIADLEVTKIGEDARGHYAIADGSLWVDGKRIYQANGLAMRIVAGPPSDGPRPARPARPAKAVRPTGEFDRPTAKAFWRDVVGAPSGWAGEDLLFGLLDRFVGRVHAEDPKALAARGERGALYVANHQVAVETILAAIIIGATTGKVTTLPAKSQHRETWIGELMAKLTSRPGLRDPRLLRFIDREDPTSVLRLREELMGELGSGRSALVHVEGTRATSCRHRVETLSAVFLDLAVEMGIDVVPVRFVGGLPVEPSPAGRFEFPVGYGKQDYWFGRPITAKELAPMPLAMRKHRVLSAINELGVTPEAEVPTAPAATFGGRVRTRMSERGMTEPKAVLLTALEELTDPSEEGRRLVGGSSDDPWLSELSAWLQSQPRS